MNIHKLLVVVLLISFLSSCSKDNVPADSKSMVISYEVTPCNGDCKAYKFTLLENGLASYKGRFGVINVGEYGTKFDQKRIAKIKKALKKANLKEFPEYFPSQRSIIADLSKTIISNGKKSVTYQDNPPKNLIELQEVLDEHIADVVWLRTDK